MKYNTRQFKNIYIKKIHKNNNKKKKEKIVQEKSCCKNGIKAAYNYDLGSVCARPTYW